MPLGLLVQEASLAEMETKDSMDLRDRKEIQDHLENEANEEKTVPAALSEKKERRADLASPEYLEPKASRDHPVTLDTPDYPECKETLVLRDPLATEKGTPDLPAFKGETAGKDPLDFLEKMACLVLSGPEGLPDPQALPELTGSLD